MLHTASEVISLARNLENESAKFYEDISILHKQNKDVFLGYSKENVKNIKQIERAYYGTASDAMEGTFAFNVEEKNYALETGLSGNQGYADALKRAINIEKVIARFYSDAAGQSQSFMADVPRVFKLMARERAERIERLESILKSASEVPR